MQQNLSSIFKSLGSYAILGAVLGLMALPGTAKASCDPNAFDYDPSNCSEPEPEARNSNESAATQNDGAAQEGAPVRIINEPVPEVQGPKRIVAVGKFDAIGSFKNQYGGWDVGGGVSAMLVRALQESDRFIVLERANMGQLLAEQELKGNKLVTAGSGPQLRRLIGVNMMIYGSVTEFGASDSGSGFSLGGSGGGLGSLLSGAISRQSTEGSIAMDIRLVDTTTSEVLETYTVREELSNSSWDLSVTVDAISAGHNTFMKTPLGAATRKAINRAVQRIAMKANDIPWEGKVISLEGRELYINAGKSSGIKVGDKFKIERVIKRFLDPTTGKLLGVRKRVIGALEITGVEGKLSYGAYLPLSDMKPKSGDAVVLAQKNS